MVEYEPPTSLPGSVLTDPDVQAALTVHDFGAVFRLARSRAGISYSKIAAETGIKPERVGALARGRGRVTSFDKIVAISDALRIPGRMIGLATRPWEGSETPAPSTSAQNGSAVQRRTVLHGLAASLPTLATPITSRQVTHDDVRRLRARTARLRRLDDVLGGGDTYRVYLSEYQATKAVLKTRTHKDATGRTLLAVLAEQAQQAGWAASDSGRSADAAGLYKESYTAAREADDADLVGNALALLAYQASAGDRRSAAEIATRSCESITSRTPSGVRALFFERKAWACAVAGHANEAERALADATAALGDTETGLQPDWASWVDATELDIMAGRCWTELRRPLRAVPVLERALAKYDDSHARDKALYLSWLADSYLMAGEVDQAVAVAGRALDLAAGVASVRPRLRLAPVLRTPSKKNGSCAGMTDRQPKIGLHPTDRVSMGSGGRGKSMTGCGTGSLRCCQWSSGSAAPASRVNRLDCLNAAEVAVPGHSLPSGIAGSLPSRVSSLWAISPASVRQPEGRITQPWPRACRPLT